MSYTIDVREDLSTVVITFHEGFSGEDQIKAYTQEIFDIYENFDQPYYQISDISEMKLDFNDVMTFIKEGVVGKQSITKHVHNKGIVIITESRFYQMTIKGLNTASFGNLKMEIFSSIEEALNWVHQQAA